MNTQHCGRMTEHRAHRHLARPRVPVQVCVCSDRICSCDIETIPMAVKREEFLCIGRIAKEGAPAFMPVRVQV